MVRFPGAIRIRPWWHAQLASTLCAAFVGWTSVAGRTGGWRMLPGYLEASLRPWTPMEFREAGQTEPEARTPPRVLLYCCTWAGRSAERGRRRQSRDPTRHDFSVTCGVACEWPRPGSRGDAKQEPCAGCWCSRAWPPQRCQRRALPPKASRRMKKAESSGGGGLDSSLLLADRPLVACAGR